MKLLEGKTALVTGVANRWSIATGIARAYAQHGARVMLAYQNERVLANVEKLAAEIGATTIQCDVSDDAMLAHLAQEAPPLDVLVHCIAFANKSDLGGKTYETTRAGFALSLDVSAFSLLALINALHDRLNDGASVIALTYLGATAIVPAYNVMGIAKAALEAAVRYAAYDLGPRGIRVNAISAGPINTASMRAVAGSSRMIPVVEAVAPLRRNVTAEDVGNVAVYLASELSSAVTADVHFVDAGYHAVGMTDVPEPRA